MIKTFHSSDQTLSKDGFALKGKYNYKFKLFGVKLFERNSMVYNDVKDKKAFDDEVESPGFKRY